MNPQPKSFVRYGYDLHIIILTDLNSDSDKACLYRVKIWMLHGWNLNLAHPTALDYDFLTIIGTHYCFFFPVEPEELLNLPK